MKVVKKKKYRKHYILMALLILLIIFFAGIFYGAYYIYKNAPDFDPTLLYNKEATVIVSQSGEEYARLGDENREIVSYNELPQVLIDAIVATEDSRFFQHNGFDIIRFFKAAWGQMKGEKNAGGASTITMQISKNTFTSREYQGLTGIIRKFTDIYLAIFQIEQKYTKEEIMEYYVNSPYLGSGSYGVEMASKTYFGKSVSDLTLPEAALIAGLFNAPGDDDPNVHLYNANTRKNQVINLMYKHGYITEEQKNDALDVDLQSLLIPYNTGNNKYQGFIDTVVEEVIEETGNNPYVEPMIIYSTIDTKAQDVVNNVVASDDNFKDNVIQTGIAITSSKDGSIVVVGNGRNRNGARQYNYATMIKRQPGSAIKPFMDYGPLFEYNGATPETTLVDEPYTYSNGLPIYDADRMYLGTMTIKEALAQSRNIPALKAFQQLDKDKVSSYVHSFGIDYGEYLYESASIGAFDGVSPLQLSAAYGAYARGGYYIEPYAYTKIVYRNSNSEYTRTLKKEKVCSEQTAKYINEILTYAINKKILGTLDIGTTEVAGKTGTTTLDKSIIESKKLDESAIMDSWANMYSAEYVISIWYGYDNITSEYYMKPIDGTLGRRRIAKDLARELFTSGSKLITSK